MKDFSHRVRTDPIHNVLVQLRLVRRMRRALDRIRRVNLVDDQARTLLHADVALAEAEHDMKKFLESNE